MSDRSWGRAAPPVPARPERPAVDVYDGLGNTLLVLACCLDAVLRAESPGARLHDLLRTRQSVTDALRTLRTVADAAEADRFRRMGLRPALRCLIDDVERTTGTYAELKTRGPVDRVPGYTAAVLVLVARECAVNLQRHARSSVLLMSVRVDERQVTLEIRDDGIDLAQRIGFGWRSTTDLSLAEVARSVNEADGEFAVVACSPRGVRFCAVLPFSDG